MVGGSEHLVTYLLLDVDFYAVIRSKQPFMAAFNGTEHRPMQQALDLTASSDAPD